MKNKEGISKYGRKEISETAKEVYKNLYTFKKSIDPSSWEEKTTNKDSVKPIRGEEVSGPIKSPKTSKVPGPDEIENEAIQILSETISEPLTKIFNKILESGTTPHQWNIAEIILLFKKRDRGNINNYRPISLSSSLAKIFMKIMKK